MSRAQRQAPPIRYGTARAGMTGRLPRCKRAQSARAPSYMRETRARTVMKQRVNAEVAEEHAAACAQLRETHVHLRRQLEIAQELKKKEQEAQQRTDEEMQQSIASAAALAAGELRARSR